MKPLQPAEDGAATFLMVDVHPAHSPRQADIRALAAKIWKKRPHLSERDVLRRAEMALRAREVLTIGGDAA